MAWRQGSKGCDWPAISAQYRGCRLTRPAGGCPGGRRNRPRL